MEERAIELMLMLMLMLMLKMLARALSATTVPGSLTRRSSWKLSRTSESEVQNMNGKCLLAMS